VKFGKAPENSINLVCIDCQPLNSSIPEEAIIKEAIMQRIVKEAFTELRVWKTGESSAERSVNIKESGARMNVLSETG
jgi:hypothetical protein